MDLKEKCGLFGVYNSDTASRDIYLGLYSEQHRGQEGAGIVVCREHDGFNLHKGNGLITSVFNDNILTQMKGKTGIGHIRYSTAGDDDIKNVQPLVVNYKNEIFGLAHNGNIVNALSLKEELENDGSIFTTNSDSEIILHRIARSKNDNIINKIVEGLYGVEGAYSLLLIFKSGIAAVRDPYGFRPLFAGRKNDSYYFASETCAFDILDIDDFEEIQPGEGYFVSENGPEKFRLLNTAKKRMCIFEIIYFSRPDSIYNNKSVHSYRVELGKELAAASPVDADVVIGVPDSSNSAAIGFSKGSGIEFDISMIRSHYTGRTFIAPYQALRDFKVKKKFNIIPYSVEGKRIVIVDDSIVRGTTSKKIIKMFRKRGVKEIHLRIAAPPIKYPCFFGIDMPDSNEFIANRVEMENLCKYLDVDSIEYLKIESLKKVAGNDYCMACFDGKYPIKINSDNKCIYKEMEKNYAFV